MQGHASEGTPGRFLLHFLGNSRHSGIPLLNEVTSVLSCVSTPHPQKAERAFNHFCFSEEGDVSSGPLPIWKSVIDVDKVYKFSVETDFKRQVNSVMIFFMVSLPPGQAFL